MRKLYYLLGVCFFLLTPSTFLYAVTEKPDLIIKDIVWVNDDPNYNDSFHLRYCNVGGPASGDIRFKIRISSPFKTWIMGGEMTNTWVPAPGTCMTKTGGSTPNRAALGLSGSVNAALTADIDIDSQVDELGELNNSFSKFILFPTTPTGHMRISSVNLQKIDALGQQREDQFSLDIQTTHAFRDLSISVYSLADNTAPVIRKIIAGNGTLKNVLVHPFDLSTSLKPGCYEYVITAVRSGDGEEVDYNDLACINDYVQEPDPTMDFTVVPIQIVKGENAVLTWSTKNVARCQSYVDYKQSNGEWLWDSKDTLWGAETGERAVSGSLTVSPDRSAQYWLNCFSKTSKQVLKTVTLEVVEQFQILTVTVDKLDALGKAAEDVRSFGFATTHPITKATLSIWENPNTSITQTPYLTTEISGNDTLRSFYVSPGWFSKKFKPETTYVYRITTYKRGASEDMNMTKEGQFTTAKFSIAAPEPKPTIASFSMVADTFMTEGDSATIRWSTKNASSCVANGDWSGERKTAGSENVIPTKVGFAKYGLQCFNESGEATTPVVATPFVVANAFMKKTGALDFSSVTIISLHPHHPSFDVEFTQPVGGPVGIVLYDMPANTQSVSQFIPVVSKRAIIEFDSQTPLQPKTAYRYVITAQSGSTPDVATYGGSFTTSAISEVEKDTVKSEKKESEKKVADEKMSSEAQGTKDDQQIVEIKKMAELLQEEKFDEILAELQQLRNKVKEQENDLKYLRSLTVGLDSLKSGAKESLNTFVTYGVDDNSKKLGEGERAAVLNSYKSAYNKLPQTDEELSDMIKIVNGRFPSERNSESEKKAKSFFKQVYKRTPNMKNNQNDIAAVMIMAYGLRQAAENRNLSSEQKGIGTFKSIFGGVPKTTEEWNIMQAVTYSGSARKMDTDKDLLADDDEAMYGTDINEADSDGDGFIDGLEVENGYNPLGPGLAKE